MILLDTNVLSELMRVSPTTKVMQFVDSFPEKSTFISAITHAEILQGIAFLPDGKRKQGITKSALAILELFNMRTLPFDQESSPIFAKTIHQRSANGRPIDFPDAQIAAIAIQHSLTLITRNIRDFEEIDGLLIKNPWL